MITQTGSDEARAHCTCVREIQRPHAMLFRNGSAPSRAHAPTRAPHAPAHTNTPHTHAPTHPPRAPSVLCRTQNVRHAKHQQSFLSLFVTFYSIICSHGREKTFPIFNPAQGKFYSLWGNIFSLEGINPWQ